ncbi:MAG: cysteine synthase A [Atribacterota bacterium]|jgi:cysteine synthase A|nr:cysteine synthase A [Atribacterota bacterium]MDD3031914.1 cysteine synthase A [Atribacterota bacterium]MDD4289087.1 cysteine synthase A [Atribacterota bacterium]MDD4764473.1 cysteine synthase A [Atribacterota bacterium]MDD5636144.1 cysteine synthase A [Atribacterota bacterium]
MQINNIIEAIGNTPLLRLNKISSGNVFAKAEFLNPGGSIKDRVAKYIIEEAEKDQKLKPGMTIIESTSGNTGIGLTLIGVQKGYEVICVMPENMSEERRKIIQAFGGKIISTPAEESLTGSIKKMKEITQQDPERYFITDQFVNPKNPETHYKILGPEIWRDTKGEIDVFVAGVGSGGTLQGMGKFLKEKNPAIKIVAVEPKNSAALLGKEPGLHQIQGIGDGFIPGVLDVNMVDYVITVSDEEAIDTTRLLSIQEGLLVGTSSGANVFTALHLDNGRNRIVTVLPDRAERYFSTALL